MAAVSIPATSIPTQDFFAFFMTLILHNKAAVGTGPVCYHGVMVNIIIDKTSDDAPTSKYVKDFNIAFAKAEVQNVLDMLTEDIIWEFVGDRTHRGKAAAQAVIADMDLIPAKKLKLDNVIAQDNRCVANGVIEYQRSKVGFCDVYTFSGRAGNLKIKTITSYGIDLV